ncbi:RNA-binding protein [Candidatus Curtissbacteria bacterium RIFCSPHIGHO2_01_FULL_41_13]|uniref:RNA-binding protein n=2 Tax=Microgenomates group TaxID=1794810 RepID=A0A1F5G2J5_9BACT|nr:MAG: RNA-binding protein [Candidatus Curtissbacteria bacterium RIFCSPHIGHO2_01_FULL_41_13]OGK41575.1 MAG: RNA-binding protein [Candidatus Roizmanbacteria bacterium RIFCSPLOWO2_01_FULL_35_13]
MAKRLFVGNLTYSVTGAQLEELFSQVGKITSLNLITDKFSGQSKGFAFVELTTDAEADEAIKKFNNFELDGRKIVVNEARPQENRDRSGGDRRYNKPRSW